MFPRIILIFLDILMTQVKVAQINGVKQPENLKGWWKKTGLILYSKINIKEEQIIRDF